MCQIECSEILQELSTALYAWHQTTAIQELYTTLNKWAQDAVERELSSAQQ